MQNLGLVLLVFGFVCAVLATVLGPQQGRFHLGWAAISFWLAAEIFGGVGRLFGSH
jgi:hypothetical protein